MLEVVTGRFHPHLESALVDRIQRVKTADPFAPLAVVVPSSTLTDHIRRLLVLEHHLALLNVHILTFHQLALRLADESHERSTPIRVVDDLFFEQLVKHIVQSRLASLAPLQHIGHSSGTWAALWSTVRDLKDAGLDPAEALRGVGERQFDRDDSDWLQSLFTLLAAVKEVGRRLNVGTPDDLAESLLPCILSAPFIRSLRHICYYGFYDLTQVQLSLFDAVSRAAPTTLFFPLDEQPSSAFSRRFFDRYVQPKIATIPLTAECSPTSMLEKPIRQPRVGLSIRTVAGTEEELALACRTILDLVETQGYRFEEIGVVARTLEPYGIELEPVFNRHCVPFTTDAGRPLIHEPACKVLLQLASLPLNDFYRTAVLDVVMSPLYRTPPTIERNQWFRPDLWKTIAAALHIVHGHQEWSRLEKASLQPMELESGEEGTGAIDRLDVAPDVIGTLWLVISPLLEACTSMPKQGTIIVFVDALRRLVEQILARPSGSRIADPNTIPSRELGVWEAIDRVLSSLVQLDILGEELTWDAFVRLLTHALERTTIPIQATKHCGVKICDVMAARGLSFKALFILGLNEKVFPRYIREDAFLHDRHRRVLEETLGFKIDEKLLGYEEEALLFSLLCQAVDRKLYLSYQRADEQGRMLAPSPYLTEAARHLGIDEPPTEAVPRRLSDRVSQRPGIRNLLPPSDLVLWSAVNGQDPSDLLKIARRDSEWFHYSVLALERMENETPRLNDFDGMTGPLDGHWSRLRERGIAPTPLERYARCPFQYFSADVLKLEPAPQLPTEEPDALLLGTLCHLVLRRCYQALVTQGWPEKPVVDEAINRCVEEAVEQSAHECEMQQRTGHFLLWEVAKEMVAGIVRETISAEQNDHVQEPFTPVAFELDAEGSLSDIPSNEGITLKIHGRVDRIDRHRDDGRLRIIDYKFKIGSEMKAEDRNLLQSATRGFRLQPPLYTKLKVLDHREPDQAQLLFLAPNWTTPVVRSSFDSLMWSTEAGVLLRNTLGSLIQGIRHGRFFIMPNGYCDGCEFRVACRREHGPTWWRASRASEPKIMKTLRALRVKHE